MGRSECNWVTAGSLLVGQWQDFIAPKMVRMQEDQLVSLEHASKIDVNVSEDAPKIRRTSDQTQVRLM